jgi:hypothetical protein
VISAVKALWKRNEANLHNDNGTIYETIIDTFFKTKKPNRIAYKILVSKKQKSPMDTQRKWVAECMLENFFFVFGFFLFYLRIFSINFHWNFFVLKSDV